MTNTLTQTTLAPRAQLFTLALAALIAPTTTAFSAVGTDYISDGTLMVPVGNPGNQANTDGFGGVPYGYSIGKYEVTNAQYALFLNAVDPTGLNNLALYSNDMAGTYGGIEKPGSTNDRAHYVVKSGTADNGMAWADMPVNYVSFWDAARFCNWLTNGGGTAAGGNADAIAASSAALTETGVYTLTSDGMTNNTVSRNVSVSEAGTLTGTGDLSGKIQTVYAVSSENEWYKAAYYNGDSTYRTYPTTKDGDTAPTNTTEANYYGSGYAFGSPYLAEVDYYGAVTGANSYYGTFQQGGNVWEWNDTITSDDFRGFRGGAFNNGLNDLASSDRFSRGSTYPSDERDDIGFRISSLLITSVPEPGTYGILGGAAALLGAIALRRRHRRN